MSSWGTSTEIYHIKAKRQTPLCPGSTFRKLGLTDIFCVNRTSFTCRIYILQEQYLSYLSKIMQQYILHITHENLTKICNAKKKIIPSKINIYKLDERTSSRAQENAFLEHKSRSINIWIIYTTVTQWLAGKMKTFASCTHEIGFFWKETPIVGRWLMIISIHWTFL